MPSPFVSIFLSSEHSWCGGCACGASAAGGGGGTTITGALVGISDLGGGRFVQQAGGGTNTGGLKTITGTGAIRGAGNPVTCAAALQDIARPESPTNNERVFIRSSPIGADRASSL